MLLKQPVDVVRFCGCWSFGRYGDQFAKVVEHYERRNGAAGAEYEGGVRE